MKSFKVSLNVWLYVKLQYWAVLGSSLVILQCAILAKVAALKAILSEDEIKLFNVISTQYGPLATG